LLEIVTVNAGKTSRELQGYMREGLDLLGDDVRINNYSVDNCASQIAACTDLHYDDDDYSESKAFEHSDELEATWLGVFDLLNEPEPQEIDPENGKKKKKKRKKKIRDAKVPIKRDFSHICELLEKLICMRYPTSIKSYKKCIANINKCPSIQREFQIEFMENGHGYTGRFPGFSASRWAGLIRNMTMSARAPVATEKYMNKRKNGAGHYNNILKLVPLLKTVHSIQTSCSKQTGNHDEHLLAAFKIRRVYEESGLKIDGFLTKLYKYFPFVKFDTTPTLPELMGVLKTPTYRIINFALAALAAHRTNSLPHILKPIILSNLNHFQKYICTFYGIDEVEQQTSEVSTLEYAYVDIRTETEQLNRNFTLLSEVEKLLENLCLNSLECERTGSYISWFLARRRQRLTNTKLKWLLFIHECTYEECMHFINLYLKIKKRKAAPNATVPKAKKQKTS